MEHPRVTGIREKGRAAGHGGQDAALAFDAQLFFDARQPCHPADQGLRLMGVQLVTDDMPADRFGLSRHDRLQMREEIGFGAGWPTSGCQQLATYDIAAEDEGARAMPHILKFPPLNFARCQRQARVLAFECLHARQLIGTHGPFSLLSSRYGLCIHGAGGFDLFVTLRVFRRRQPIADHVWL